MIVASGRPARGFSRGRSVYVCDCCKRRTRETTVSGSDLCGLCFELAGLQNAVWDGCFGPIDALHRDDLLAQLAKLGGQAEAVRAEFADLFDWRPA